MVQYNRWKMAAPRATAVPLEHFVSQRFEALVHDEHLARDDPRLEAVHLPIPHDVGLPRPIIRLRALQASSASTTCPRGVRVRRPS